MTTEYVVDFTVDIFNQIIGLIAIKGDLLAEILGIEYEGIPYGNAQGAINGTNTQLIRDRLSDVLRSPVAFAGLGSLGSHRNEGNHGTTYYHDPVDRKTVNAIGLSSIGLPDATPIIKEFSRKFADAGKILFVGVTTLRGEEANEVLPNLAEQAYEAGAHVVEVNYSCPNIVTADGGRKPILGYDVDAMEATRAAIIRRVGSDRHIQEKLPPYLHEYAGLIPEIAATYSTERRLGKIGVTGFNTVPNITPLKENGEKALRIIAKVDGGEVVTHAGGMSGPYVASGYNQLQTLFLRWLPDDVPFIRAGGIWSGQEVARTMLDSRVVAASGVTRFWESDKVGTSFGATARNIAMEYEAAL